MSKIDTGGPAYPTRGSVTFIQNTDGTRTATPADTGGMTLLDWFAGQAMAGILGNPALANAITKRHPKNIDSVEWVVDAAYVTAAAMLAEKRRREAGQ